MEDIAKFFIGLFKDLRPPLRWLALGGSLVVLILGLFAYEQVTQNIYLTKLEKKVALLRQLQQMAAAGIEKNAELYPIYLELVSELNTHTPAAQGPSIAGPLPIRKDPYAAGKAISGAVLWLVLLLFVLGYQLKLDRRFSAVSAALVIFFLAAAGLFAWIGAQIPTLGHPWVNYLLLPLLQSVAVVWAARKPAEGPAR